MRTATAFLRQNLYQTGRITFIYQWHAVEFQLQEIVLSLLGKSTNLGCLGTQNRGTQRFPAFISRVISQSFPRLSPC
jgi:hypothetical protein